MGQGFSGLFQWRRSLEVYQRDRSHAVRGRPHGYQMRWLYVINFVFVFFFISLFRFFIYFFSYYSLCRYIDCKLVIKNVFPTSLLSFLDDWIDENSNLCVYTHIQLAKFLWVHLMACVWYLYCSRGFVPKVEEPLYNNLVCSSPEVIELEEESEEDDNPAPPTHEKKVAFVKGKGKGKRVASSQVSMCSFSKASIQCTPTPAPTLVGGPTATLSAPLPNHVPALSHSGAAIPSVPRKRKAMAPDTSTTSFERSCSLCLIEIVDMGEFIEDLMKTKVPPPAYCRIQDFLTKVCVSFHLFLHSFHEVHHLFFSLIFLFRLDQAVLVQTPSLRFTRALMYFLQMCPRTCVCLTFWSHSWMFLLGTNDLPPTLRFCLPSQIPTPMTTAFLS